MLTLSKTSFVHKKAKSNNNGRHIAHIFKTESMKTMQVTQLKRTLVPSP